ncbi:MAG: helix-turn-helix domain-containing protein [Bacteroidota bacterium]
MQVICLEETAFYELVEEVVRRVKEKEKSKLDTWVGTDEAMRVLGVKSKTTLQRLRNEGKIRYSQPQKKNIMYDLKSLNTYLENNARNIF